MLLRSRRPRIALSLSLAALSLAPACAQGTPDEFGSTSFSPATFTPPTDDNGDEDTLGDTEGGDDGETTTTDDGETTTTDDGETTTTTDGGEATTGGPVCGNAMIEGGEACDGADLNGQSCLGLGYDGGTLSCNADCGSYNTTNCVFFVCGNGVLEGAEVCDGINLNGQSCVSQGFSQGTLGCAANCLSFDLSGCTNGTPGGTCCTSNLTPGCSVPSIEQCVCALDSFCCDNGWDALCAVSAVDDCGAIC